MYKSLDFLDIFHQCGCVYDADELVHDGYEVRLSDCLRSHGDGFEELVGPTIGPGGSLSIGSYNSFNDGG